jgi:OOP family OmpA-OmpF porin
MPLRFLVLALLLATACPPAPPPKDPGNQALIVDKPPEDVPPPTATLSEGQIKLSEPIVFVVGQDILAPESEAILAALAKLLADRTDITLIRVEGHSDAQGAEDFNQEMSERRAFALARWLVGSGIDCTRLIPVGFGENKPIADNRTAEGRNQNRRMELVPAALRGHLINGAPADGGGRVAGDPCAP